MFSSANNAYTAQSDDIRFLPRTLLAVDRVEIRFCGGHRSIVEPQVHERGVPQTTLLVTRPNECVRDGIHLRDFRAWIQNW